MSAPTSIDERVLIASLKEGDGTAFAEIYNLYKATLFLHAVRTLKDEDEARDIVQEVFTNLWDNRFSIEVKGELATYLYGAVRNRVFNFMAKVNVRGKYALSLQPFLDKGEFITDATVRERELLLIIEKEINALPEKMREVFLLSRNTDLTHKQIALQLGLSDNTVKKQVANAVKILRTRLDPSIINIFFHFF